MPNQLTLQGLLMGEKDPSVGAYDEVVDSLLSHPSPISALADADKRDEQLFLLTTRSDRLVNIFRRLHTALQIEPKLGTGHEIAKHTLTFLQETVVDLYGLLSISSLVALFIPAIDLCFAARPVPSLTRLADLLANCGTLLEQIISDPFGKDAMFQWISQAESHIANPEVLARWATRLVALVQICPGNHGKMEPIQRWSDVTQLKQNLRALERKAADVERQAGSFKGHADHRNLTKIAGQAQNPAIPNHHPHVSSFPSLDDETMSSLKSFQLRIPGSTRVLQQVTEDLNGAKTAEILMSMASTFPCRVCKESLLSTGANEIETSPSTLDSRSYTTQNIDLGILGSVTGVWKILLSVDALNSLRELSVHFSAIKRQLNVLAAGDFNRELTGEPHQQRALRVPLYKMQTNRDQFILWQIGIGASDSEQLEQMIIVWDAGSSAQLSHTIDRVMVAQKMYTKEEIRQCRRQQSALRGVQVPLRFRKDELVPLCAETSREDLDLRQVDPKIIEMANKFYTFTEPLIRSLLSNDLLGEYPLDTDGKEKDIISHFDTASLILGRSGTGKTTCLVYKLVAKHLTGSRTTDERPPRQILLTRSGFLADKLRLYTRRLIRSLGSVRCESTKETAATQASSLNDGDIISKTTAAQLRDHDFPLVCTWDQFIAMIENTVKIMDRQSFDQSADSHTLAHHHWISGSRRHMVNFHVFKTEYWPSFPAHLTKSLSVDLAYPEIIGVIKGSKFSRQTLEPITREAYNVLSDRVAPTFSLEADRGRIYDIYQLYESRNREHGAYDAVDRVIKLVKAIRSQSALQELLTSTFEEMYIDEIQDQRCLDIQLLLEFVRDGRGFHFAGDTAQAISQDSTFRFADIKDLFYEHFSLATIATGQAQLSRPKLFALSKNYRSHQGILGLAAFVMGLLYDGYPDTVDKLSPEWAKFSSSKPVFFGGCLFSHDLQYSLTFSVVGCGWEVLVSTQVGIVDLSITAGDFGAEQVILVRDTEAKLLLRKRIGKVALILTILESKGMEFDDVVVWNFFTDSPNGSAFRKLRLLSSDKLTFDSRKYSGLCSELKHLYVGITRARVRLFFIEENGKSAAPIVQLFTDQNPLIEVTSAQNANVFRTPMDHVFKADGSQFEHHLKDLRKKTTVNRRLYEQRGEELEESNNYKDAALCFKLAENTDKMKAAKAKHKEVSGLSLAAAGHHTAAGAKFGKAAQFFADIGRIQDSAVNLVREGRFKEATDLLINHGHYSEGGIMLLEAKQYKAAATCFVKAKLYNEAATSFHTGEHHNDLVNLLCKHGAVIDPMSMQRYRVFCKLLLKTGKLTPESRKAGISLLGSSREQEICFESYGMTDELGALYSAQGRHLEHFTLLVEKASFEDAFLLALSGKLGSTQPLETTRDVVRLAHYSCAGRVTTGQSPLTDRMLSALSRPEGIHTELRHAMEEWRQADPRESCQNFGSALQDPDIEIAFASAFRHAQTLRAITSGATVSSFEDLPFEAIVSMVKLARGLRDKGNTSAWEIAYLIAGIWQHRQTHTTAAVLSWSALFNDVDLKEGAILASRVREYIYDLLAAATPKFDSAARQLWRIRWPQICQYFVFKGQCRDGNDCSRPHRIVTRESFRQTLDDLLRISFVVCNLKDIYLQKVWKQEFQSGFLGILRYWLEKLLRELTYISPFEQDSTIIKIAQEQISHSARGLPIKAAVESLLFYRLGLGSNVQWGFSSVLAQLQAAGMLGVSVQQRFFRYLSFKLQGSWIQQYFSKLGRLELDADCMSALEFRKDLRIFLAQTEQIDISGFVSFHAVTAVIERLTTYLIFKSSPKLLILPQACVELHVPWLSQGLLPDTPPAFEEKAIYQECIVLLIASWCRILQKLDIALKPPDDAPFLAFKSEGSTYHHGLIQQRNIDIIVIAALVLNANRYGSNAFTLACVQIQKTVELFSVQTQVWRHRDLVSARENCLQPAFAKYGGKNNLVCISSDASKLHSFKSLGKQGSVRKMTHAEIRKILGSALISSTSAKPGASAKSSANDGHYAKVDIDRIRLIQQCWRAVLPKLKVRRAWLATPQAQTISRLIAIGGASPSPIVTRAILVSKGVLIQEQLDKVHRSFADRQKAAREWTNNMEPAETSYELLDNIMRRLVDLNITVKTVDEGMSTANLQGYVQVGDVSGLQDVLQRIREDLTGLERELVDVKKDLKMVVAKDRGVQKRAG